MGTHRREENVSMQRPPQLEETSPGGSSKPAGSTLSEDNTKSIGGQSSRSSTMGDRLSHLQGLVADLDNAGGPVSPQLMENIDLLNKQWKQISKTQRTEVLKDIAEDEVEVERMSTNERIDDSILNDRERFDSLCKKMEQ